MTTPSGYAAADEYFATKYQQGGRTVYAIDLSPAQITTTIKKPDADGPISRTNREISPGHASSFAMYLQENVERIIPPLLLRAPIGELEFTASESIDGTSFGRLAIPKLLRDDIEILDGQHRILGMHIAMKSLSDQIKEQRSARAQTHTITDEGARAARERQLDKDIEKLEDRRRLLGSERVTVQIVVVDDEDEVRQMFHDIAANAKGITQSVKARFDQRKLVNRIMQEVITEHPLLLNRVDDQKDRLIRSNPNLVGAKHVAEAVQTVLVGIGGRISRRQEAERNERDAKRDVVSFLNAIVDGFDDYRGIVEGAIVPPALREKSLLGSAVMFRVLAGVFHEMAMTDDTPTQSDKTARVVQRFKDIQPWMALPISWSNGSPWIESQALPKGSNSALSRTQHFKEMVTLITRWTGAARTSSPSAAMETTAADAVAPDAITETVEDTTATANTPADEVPAKSAKYTATTKWCAFCERMLPHAAFAQNVTQPHGLMGWCRECNSVHRAVHRYARAHGMEYRDVPDAIREDLRAQILAGVRGAGGARLE